MSAPGPDGIVCDNGCDAWNIDRQCPQHGSDPVLSDAEIVERTIEFAEALGMYLDPWQVATLRSILNKEALVKRCENPCCAEHSKRHCHLPSGHDGNHADGDGHQWRNQRLS